jgi:site-specific DNA-methyltransferase (adenine-specific)
MPAPKQGTQFVDIADIQIGDRDREDLGNLLGLAKSISSVGLINPIIVDKDLNLIAGLRRIEATKLLKSVVIEARQFESLTAYERQRITIEEEILHKKTLTWQEEISLKQQLHDLYLKDHEHIKREVRGKAAWSQKSTAEVLGMNKNTLSEELRLAKALEAFPELLKIKSKSDAIRKMYRMREFALLQAIARKQSEAGETKFKNIEFLNGDCFDILPTIEDESVDLVITDPPWGIGLTGMQGARSVEYEMFDDNVRGIYTKVIPELFRVMKDGSHLWLFFGIEHYEQIKNLLVKTGFDTREIPNVWIKEGPSFSNWEYKPMPQSEFFFFAVKSVHGAPKQLKEATSDVFDYKRAKGTDKIHPTEKPIELIKRLITLSSAPGELILDPFAGSASTLISAALLDRRCIGIEQDKNYYEISMGRLQNYLVEKELEVDESV